MNEKQNKVLSYLGLFLLSLELILLFVFKLQDLFFLIALPIMALIVLINVKFKIHITIAFVSSVIWMVGAIYYWPQPNGVNRIWEFSDFLPVSVCGLNFLLGAWLYIYNRVRW